MEDGTKICPYCGNRIKAIAKKCKYCKTWLNGEDERENYEYHNNEDFRGCFKDFMGCLGSLLVIGIVIVGFISIRNIPEDFWQTLLANFVGAKCESPYVKELIIDLFKENYPIYKTIDPSSIASIDIEMPIPTEFDSSINKYTCKGTIVMKATSQGFLPNKNVNDDIFTGNSFLTKMVARNLFNQVNDGMYHMKKYDTYKLNIIYTSQVAEKGQIYVEMPQPEVYDWLDDLLNEDKFSCSGYCEDILLPINSWRQSY